MTASDTGPSSPAQSERGAYPSGSERERISGLPQYRPSVVIDPAMCSGEPSILGRRLPVYLVAETVWQHGVGEAEFSYELTRAQVLVACWYAAVLPVVIWGRGGVLKAQRNPWPKRWAEWAQTNHGYLWKRDYDVVTDPPAKAGAR